MRNLKDFKTFEAEQIGPPILARTEEDLMSYYKCNACDALWKNFNEESTSCKFCRNNDITKISVYDYMTSLREKGDKAEYNKEMKDYQKRVNNLVSMVDLAWQKQSNDYRKFIN